MTSPIRILLPVFAVVLIALGPVRGQEAFMVMEAYSGKVLIAKNSTAKRPVASLTKIATAVVALDWAEAAGTDIAKVMVTSPPTISLVGGPNPLNLQPGDQMSLRDALYAALLSSDNLAALTVADHIGRELLQAHGKSSGDPVAEFVVEMNRLAKALGMKNTRFGNPHGLEREGVKAASTAADIARLSVYAMRRNAFNFIVRQKDREITVMTGIGRQLYKIHNTNELIGEEGILGIKTGTTAAAGECLAVCMDKDPLVRQKPDGSKGVTPRRLIVVLLNSTDRFQRSRMLLRDGWAVYDSWLAAGAPVKDAKREIIKVTDPQ